MVRLKFKSDPRGLMHSYTGSFGAVREGDEFNVTDDLAAQLMRDFPFNFEKVEPPKPVTEADILEKAKQAEASAVEEAPDKMVTEKRPATKKKKGK